MTDNKTEKLLKTARRAGIVAVILACLLPFCLAAEQCSSAIGGI